jgi:thymidylate synthase ThyX
MEFKQIKVELQETMGGDRSIAEAAWTSSLDYQKKQSRTDEDVKRVVEMLATARHSTPFESIILRFWIKMPIAIDRQFMTHRLQSASGMSGRYRTMPSEYLDIPDDVMDICNMIPTSGSYQLPDGKGTIYGMDDFVERYYQACEVANNSYSQMNLIAKDAEKLGHITNTQYKRFREFMRGMLPQHNMTERVSIMNLRAFSNFQKTRILCL